MKKIIFLAFILAGFITASAQVAIGTKKPHASSILHLKALGTTKGLILPRMSDVERNDILSPPAGLVIYNNVNKTVDVVVDGTPNAWRSSDASTLTNVTTGAATTTGGVGIGTITPNKTAILDIDSPNKGVLIPTLATTNQPTASLDIEGMIYYNTTDNKVKLCNGSAWVDLATY